MTQQDRQKLATVLGSGEMSMILEPVIRNTKEGLIRTWAGHVVNYVDGVVISVQKDGKELLT
jgi:hypothetical protein